MTAHPALPSADLQKRAFRVSLYVDQGVTSYRRTISRFADDSAVGTVSADFALGPPMSETIRQSAIQAFDVVSVVGSVACGRETDFLVVVEFSRTPELDLSWRKGAGRSSAVLPMKVSSQPCEGGQIEERTFVAEGTSKPIPAARVRPGSDAFAPGVEEALVDLSRELGQVFAELPALQ